MQMKKLTISFFIFVIVNIFLTIIVIFWYSIFDSHYNFSYSTKFIFTIILQELVLIWSFVISLKYYLWKELPIYDFVLWQLKYKGLSKFFILWVWYFFIFIVFSILINLFIEFTNVSLPFYNWEQQVKKEIWFLQLDNTFIFFLTAFFLIIVVPFVEELVFRWYITCLLIHKLWNISWIILWSLIFSLAHLEIDVFINLFIISIFLSLAYIKSKSILYPFFLHMLVNYFAFLMI